MGYAPKGEVLQLKRPTSFSSMHDFDECPRRYYWAHVLKTKRDPAALELKYGYGGWFHTRAEMGFKSMIADLDEQRKARPFVPPMPNVALFTHGAYADGIPAAHQKKWESMMTHFVNWLNANKTWLGMLCALNSPQIEVPFALSKDWKPLSWDGVTRERQPNLALRGKLDLTILNPPLVTTIAGVTHRTPGRAHFWDWKTSTLRASSSDPATVPQLGLYAFSLFCRYDWLEEVTGTFYNVRWKSPEPPLTFTRQYAFEMGPLWADTIVRDLMERDPYNVECWEPKTNKWCQLCEFKDQCPLAKQLRYSRARAIAATAASEAGD